MDKKNGYFWLSETLFANSVFQSCLRNLPQVLNTWRYPVESLILKYLWHLWYNHDDLVVALLVSKATSIEITQRRKIIMFCKNCGNTMDPGAAVCTKCGVSAGQGSGYCSNCGKELPQGAAVCLACGFTVKAPISPNAKSKLTAGLLGVLLGSLGVHNFYLGYTGEAVAQLVVFIVCVIISILTCGLGILLLLIPWAWGLVEGIMILTGHTSTDSKGEPLKD